MLSTLIGWKVAGAGGAVTATVALYLPSSLLVFGVSRLWGRWRGSVWHGAIERGLEPIAAGLVLAGGLAVLQAAGGAAVWAAAAAATGVLLRWPRLNPLILFGASGAMFAAAALFGWR
jgi:chromate transporter